MDTQRLIGEVARRHNVLVDPGDPIFVTVTLNELLVTEYLEKVEDAFARLERAATTASIERYEAARTAAEQALSSAAKEAGERVRVAGTQLKNQLERLVSDSLSDARCAVQEARAYRQASIWAAVIGAGCVVLIGAFAVFSDLIH